MTEAEIVRRRLVRALPRLLTRVGMEGAADALQLGFYGQPSEAELTAVRKFLRRTLHRVTRLAARERARAVAPSDASVLIQALMPSGCKCGHEDEYGKRGESESDPGCSGCTWPAWAHENTEEDPWRLAWLAEAISRACLSILEGRRDVA